MAKTNREFLMLAHPYMDKKKGTPRHNVKGWFVSEKLDGVRAWWDGGISRGLEKSRIPWANNTSKDDRYVVSPTCSGLWSRYGHPIMAPDWFLDAIPKTSLDGELYMGRGLFQSTVSATGKLVPNDSEWERVSYNVFEAPPYPQVFNATHIINGVNFQKQMDLNECMDFVRLKIPGYSPRFRSFEQTIAFLDSLEITNSFRVVEQTKLERLEDLDSKLDEILLLSGEGVMLRKPGSYWEAYRSNTLLKYKPFEDAEGIATGYTWGRRTEKGSKLLGKMGALVLDFKGKRLELSGFTDSLREMTFRGDNAASQDEGLIFPGGIVSDNWTNKNFPVGSIVTFRYRELTDDGIPREARYHRRREGHA